MNFSALVRSRLAKLGYRQTDLARAAQVTDSYISQLLGERKAPPGRDRTDIYSKMEAFLHLAPGELARLAEIDRAEELKCRLGRTAEPRFQRLRDLVLRKCVPERRAEVRTNFESQSFGTLEHLVARKLLDVVQRAARRELDAESCIEFLDPLVQSWSVDLETFRIDIVLDGSLVADPRRTITFVEDDADDRSDGESGLAEFLEDPRLDDPPTEEEIPMLRRHRFGGRRPNSLYYYRALQNLRDPLHFQET